MTNWTWANGPNNVKSCTCLSIYSQLPVRALNCLADANVESSTVKGAQLSNITSVPTAWNWTYATKSSDIRADVS